MSTKHKNPTHQPTQSALYGMAAAIFYSLAVMITAVTIAVSLAGCATTAQPQDGPQVTYVQACAAYGVAFSTALQLREAGRLNRAQIDQVTLLDSQVTPICTGALPLDPTAAAQQITAGVTTLTILELAQKAN